MTVRQAVTLGLAVAVAAGCDPETAAVSVRTDPPALANQLERVEVSIVGRCDAQGVAGAAPVGSIATIEVDRAGDAMSFGALDRGERGLYARGWDGDCDVVAAGCAPVTIGDGDLEVVISAVTGPGCDASELCQATRCVAGDAGANDAGGVDGGGDAGADAGSDAGATDAGTPPTLACPPPMGTANEDPVVLYTFEAPDDFAGVADRAPAAPDVPLTGVSGPMGEVVTFDGRSATFVGGHLAATQPLSEELQNAILATGAFSVEAWFSVADLVVEEPSGPERLVTLSESTSRRSFTIGPERERLQLRVRSAITDASGFECEPVDPMRQGRLATPDFLTANGPPTQVVLTFDETEGPRAYINGAREAWGYCPGTATLDWVADVNQLLLGQEQVGDRTLDGSIFRVAIYTRALTDGEVACWFSRGPDLSLYD